MCRAKGTGKGELGRRCPSCQDKEKRSAYNRAAYLIRKLAAEKAKAPIVEKKPGFFPRDFDDDFTVSPNDTRPVSSSSSEATNPTHDEEALRAENDALIQALLGSPKLAEAEPREQLSELERLAQMVTYDAITQHAQELFADSEEGWGSFTVNYSDLTESIVFTSDIHPSAETTAKTMELSDRIHDAFEKEIVFGSMDSPIKVKCQATTIQWEDNIVIVRGEVKDENGTYVSGWVREIFYQGNKYHSRPFMEYSLLRIADDYRNQSLGTKLISHFDSVTLAAGIDTVMLEANIDIGGYAWAKQGYDWNVTHPDYKDHMNDLLSRMHKEVSRNPDTAQEVSAMLQRLQKPYNPDYPLPVDISNLGKDTIDSDGLWAGKRIMLNSTWQGMRTLA